MSKAEDYLYKRISILSEEKQILNSKIQNIELEMQEIDSKIIEMKNNLDVAFEIFSPRTKKNDFIRTEIESLTERNKELQQKLDDLQQQYILVEGDIFIIQDALNNEESCEKTDINEDERQDLDIVEDKVEENIKSNYAGNINEGIRILEQYEFEKQKIANGIKNSSIQMLNNLVHKCEVCSKVINVDSTRAKLELEVMSSTIKEVIDELGDVVYNLCPMSFENANFKETIMKEINKLTQYSNIYVSTEIEGEYDEISSTILITIIRIVVETITNSLKHANSNNLNISMDKNNNTIIIKIEDDGVGFDVDDVYKSCQDNKSYYGLSMIKERIIMLNGNMEITSEIGKGTKITYSFPVEHYI